MRKNIKLSKYLIITVAIFGLMLQGIKSGVTVGQIKINSSKETAYVAQTGGANGAMSIQGDTVYLNHGTRGYITLVDQSEFTPNGFYKLQLLDKTLSFTMDLSQAGCGCNAALYLTPMPAYNSNQQPDATRCGDYYCDANNVCGVFCPEIDIVEGNNQAMQVTPHKCNAPKDNFYDSCDGAGCYYSLQKSDPDSFGLGAGKTIDTRYPFDVQATFRTKNNVLVEIETIFLQNGKLHVVSQTDGSCGGTYIAELTESFKKGMVIIFSYWGDANNGNEMSWLDAPPCNPNQGCNTKSQINFKNFVVSPALPPRPPQPIFCKNWLPNTNYKKGTVVLYKGEKYTSIDDWNGTVGDPYTVTHSESGWGWKIGGECNVKKLEFLE